MKLSTITLPLFIILILCFSCKKEVPGDPPRIIYPVPPPITPAIIFDKKPPVVYAGPYLFFNHPPAEVILNGLGNDSDGFIVSYNWNQLSGPGISKILNPGDAVTKITDLQYGFYLFQLKVTDNDDLTAIDQVGITIDSSGVDPCYGCWDY
jgi:hypothetical protein